MTRVSRILLGVVTAILACTFATPGWAQALTSAAATVALAAVKPESISVTITTPGPVNFNPLTGTTTAGSVTPAWTTNWNLKPSRTSVAVCVFLSGPLAGTGGNLDTIPAANVQGQPGGVGPFAALTGSGCGQVNALTISTTVITGANRKNGSKSDSVAAQINETGIVPALSADTYSGTLNIIAQATP